MGGSGCLWEASLQVLTVCQRSCGVYIEDIFLSPAVLLLFNIILDSASLDGAKGLNEWTIWMRCYEIWFSSLLGSNGYRRIVGLDDLVGSFQPCDSMIWEKWTCRTLTSRGIGIKWVSCFVLSYFYVYFWCFIFEDRVCGLFPSLSAKAIDFDLSL